MPVGAHNPTGARRRGRGSEAERGFSLVEMIIVLVLVAIALMAAIYSFSTIKRSSNDTKYAAAASTIWRGVGAWRQDNKGTLPPGSALAAGGAAFTNLTGTRYVRQWPEDPGTAAPLALQPGPGTPGEQGTANTVVYSRAASGETGWLAAYGHDGRLVFLRGITPGGTPEVPVG